MGIYNTPRINELRQKRKHLYKQLDTVKHQINQAKSRIDTQQMNQQINQPTFKKDIIKFITTTYKPQDLDSIPAVDVYNRYIKKTRYYKDVTKNKFTYNLKRIEPLNIDTKQKRLNGESVQVYYHKSNENTSVK